MIGALAQVVPEKVAGDLCRTSFHNLIGGYDAATPARVGALRVVGRRQRRLRRGGRAIAMAPFDWGDLVTVQSSEVIETRFPLLWRSRGWGPTGGAGARAAGSPCAGACAADGGGGVLAAVGRGDGAGVRRAGRGPRLPVALVEGERRRDPLRHAGQGRRPRLHAGDLVVLRSAGGGGYGDPLERPAERSSTTCGRLCHRRGRARRSTGSCSRGCRTSRATRTTDAARSSPPAGSR